MGGARVDDGLAQVRRTTERADRGQLGPDTLPAAGDDVARATAGGLVQGGAATRIAGQRT